MGGRKLLCLFAQMNQWATPEITVYIFLLMVTFDTRLNQMAFHIIPLITPSLILNLGFGDQFVTLRVENGGLVGMANPVWLQHTIVGDIDGDGEIGITDLLSILETWGECSNCISDLDHDGFVGINDLLGLIALW